MSSWWVIVVKGFHGVTGPDYAVLRSLAWKARDDGVVTITADALVEESHVSKATLFRALNRLERAGLIERDRSGRTTTYRLIHSQPATVSACDMSQDESIKGSQDESLGEPDSLTVRPSGSQDETLILSPVRHIETETHTNKVLDVVPNSKVENLELIQTDVTPRHIPMPPTIQRFITDLTPGLTDKRAAEWQDVWQLAQQAGHIEDPGMTLRSYLSDCRKRGVVPDPDRWTRWHTQAERWAREGVEKARQEARRAQDNNTFWHNEWDG